MHTQTQSSFAIDGMFCGGCAATVERALGRVAGVEAASVSFVSDAALVRHDRGVSPAKLAEIITGLGYGVRPLADNDNDDGYATRNAFLRSHQIRLAVAVFLGMWTMLASVAGYLGQVPTPQLAWKVALASGVFALPVLLFSGTAFYRLGWRSLRAGAPGMEALITLAVLAATTVSIVNLARGAALVYFDAAVMLITFQLIARLTDFSVRRRAGDAVRRLLALAPERARRLTKNGIESVHPRDLVIGDLIEARPGERLAADGIVRSGSSQLDTSLITGESMGRTAKPGNTVLAGTQVLDGLLKVEVCAAGGQREIDVLATEVRRLIVGKGGLARLADKVAFWLLPTIIIAAVLALAFALATGAGWQAGISHALAVMIVTCPCALSLAVPLVQTAAASAAARRGIVLRDPGALEKASRIDTVVFDKTGTVTNGEPTVTNVHCAPGYSKEDVITAAARAEHGSNHPLAKAIRNDAAKQTETEGEFKEHAGCGVETIDNNGNTWRAGSANWFRELGLQPVATKTDPHATRVEVSKNRAVLGAIELSDALRPDAQHIIQQLKQRGYRIIIASGDSTTPVQAVAQALRRSGESPNPVTDIQTHAELKPADKLNLIKSLHQQGRRVAFVGDGLNDGPALAAADLGIAVGSASDLARSAAAVGLLREGLEPVATALALIRKAGRVLKQNLAWALAYNAILLPAAIAGYIHPLFAALAMAASSISVSLNSLRASWLRSNNSNRRHSRATFRHSRAGGNPSSRTGFPLPDRGRGQAPRE